MSHAVIIQLSEPTPVEQVDAVRERVEALGCRTYASGADERPVVACVSLNGPLNSAQLAAVPGVAAVVPLAQPYPRASWAFRAGRTLVSVGDRPGTVVGGRELAIIAGPCSVEERSALLETARSVRRAGATMLRGGAFKPRSSPYSFRGLGDAALELLAEVREATGLPIVTEVMDLRQVEAVAGRADVLQIGARSMQNFPLLEEVGRVRRPVLLKRGFCATVTELLLAAEYVLAAGNEAVMLCERGIRTFEPSSRNTLDLAAVATLQRETHLPVLVDPSHAAGRADLVAPLACAAVAAGADGLLIEVHPDPERALSDGEQSLTPGAFGALMQRLAPIASAVGRTLLTS